eukprot:CAMPEP_0181447942 /NCGR_PEP_ID=MMETSP1110-20121109/26883_1 /TAXON_ID=174948 /ORGANISM="Symbiodinium sp., Strain CCMP421" /LENGTH=73 /DNA_ID=CAMNT_0023572073 /DNA_START=87 /DNA_END=305 /DNA_ORIENTATION=+
MARLVSTSQSVAPALTALLLAMVGCLLDVSVDQVIVALGSVDILPLNGQQQGDQGQPQHNRLRSFVADGLSRN